MAKNTTRIANSQPNQPTLTASEALGITATASGNQTTATLLPDGCNEITTVANSGDSVKLPPAVGGMTVFVANQGANPCQVFGSGIDTINNVATATGVSLTNGKNAVFFCIKSANAAAATAGEWYMILSA